MTGSKMICSRCGKEKMMSTHYIKMTMGELYCADCRYIMSGNRRRARYKREQELKKLNKKDPSGTFAKAFKSKTGRDLNV